MTRQEFIRKLQEALNGKLDAATIQDHLKFYDDYIIEEMRKGKSEQEVLELLGDPWAIAKTIVDASDGTDEEVVYENRSPFNNSYNQTTQAHFFVCSITCIYNGFRNCPRISEQFQNLLLALSFSHFFYNIIIIKLKMILNCCCIKLSIQSFL